MDYHTSPYENVVTALSLDGQAGSLIEYGADGTSNEEGIAYSFVGFGSGSKTFSLTRSKVISEGAAYSFIFFSGANISNPIKDHDTAVKLGATPAAITTPNMDSGTDCIVLALCSAWNSTPTMTGGGETLIESGLYNQTRYGVAFLAGTGATDTATATCEYARLIGVVVQPAAGGTIEGSGNVDAVGSVIQTQKLLLNQSGDVDSIGSGMQTQKLLLKQSGDIDTTSNLTETQKLLYKTSGNIDAAVDMTESNKLLYKLAGIIDAAVDMTQTGTLLLKISGEIDALADILFQYQDIVSVTATMDVSTDAAVSYRLLQKQLANIDAVGSVSLSSITIMLNAIIDTIGSMLAQQEVIGDVHFRLTAVMKNISELTSEIKNTSRLTTIIKI